MVSALLSRVVILVFGTLYPAYSSYKAVKTKNVKEYVKWMMYWIVFALFTTVETFADVLVSWFPFYYELKIVFVIWLLSPATKGSSVLYRKFVHPELMKREGEIDQTLEKVKTQGYSALVNVGQQGLNLAVQTAMTGQTKLIDHVMKKSLSMGDISQGQGDNRTVFVPQHERIVEAGDETDFHRMPRPMDIPRSESNPEKMDHEKQVPVASAPPPEHMGYDLRSREYHEELPTRRSTKHSPHSYSHTEGYHYGTLPRRAVSMRSKSDGPKAPVEIVMPPPSLKPLPPKTCRSRSSGWKRTPRKTAAISKNKKMIHSKGSS